MAWTKILTLHEDIGSSKCSLWDGTSPLVQQPNMSCQQLHSWEYLKL